jgi:hypothetical protein
MGTSTFEIIAVPSNRALTSPIHVAVETRASEVERGVEARYQPNNGKRRRWDVVQAAHDAAPLCRR